MSEPKKPAVPKRPGAKAGFLGALETSMTIDRPADNMVAEKTADMTFKMPPKWHGEFKATAAIHGLSMKELFVECFEAWKRERQAADRMVAKDS